MRWPPVEDEEGGMEYWAMRRMIVAFEKTREAQYDTQTPFRETRVAQAYFNFYASERSLADLHLEWMKAWEEL